MSGNAKPRRLLVVLPSWVGDAVMATPSLRALRDALPGTLIGGLMRPGLDQLLAGTRFLDEVHVERAAGMMGPKRAAAKVRHLRYDAALLLTNSFSTALITRLAGIERRIGYDRDGRGLLLTERLRPLRRRDAAPYNRSTTAPHEWAPVPAVDYYFALARRLLASCGIEAGAPGPMELAVTPEEDAAADELLRRAGLTEAQLRGAPMAVLNPGGNDERKRWPAERFAALGAHLHRAHGLTILVNGSPGEAALAGSIIRRAAELACASAAAAPPGGPSFVDLPALGVTLGTLKSLARRSRLMVTNDTGPRHIAAALGTPVVSLFGPTDHRWTTIPFDRETILCADPTLPEEEVANDHPERCRMDRIEAAEVIRAAEGLLTRADP